MRALSDEVCKNLALAGVASITLLDHEKVTEFDLGAQFFLTDKNIGQNVRDLDTILITTNTIYIESRSSST
jgi:molybdopterin/thiamine biosynthesis adenylyltransferase